MPLIKEITYRNNKRCLKENIRIFIKKIESGEFADNDDNVIIGLLEEDNKRLMGLSDNFTVLLKENLGANLKIKGKRYSQIENRPDWRHDSCTIPSGVLGWDTYEMKYAKGSIYVNDFCQELKVGSGAERQGYNKDFKHLYRYLLESDKSYISIKELKKIKKELNDYIYKKAVLKTEKEPIEYSVN